MYNVLIQDTCDNNRISSEQSKNKSILECQYMLYRSIKGTHKQVYVCSYTCRVSCTVAVWVRMSNCRRPLPSHLLRSLSSLSLLCDCSKSYFSCSMTITRHTCSSPHNTKVHTYVHVIAHWPILNSAMQREHMHTHKLVANNTGCTTVPMQYHHGE